MHSSATIRIHVRVRACNLGRTPLWVHFHVPAYIAAAYIAAAHVVMAYTAMAYTAMVYSYGLYRYGLYGYCPYMFVSQACQSNYSLTLGFAREINFWYLRMTI